MAEEQTVASVERSPASNEALASVRQEMADIQRQGRAREEVRAPSMRQARERDDGYGY